MCAESSKSYIRFLNLPRVTFGEESEMPTKLFGKTRAKRRTDGCRIL
jgi:hypothetical protein